MANTGKDAAGSTIFLRAPFGTGADNTNAYNYGTAVYFSRNGVEQLVSLDTATPANNRPLPVVLVADGGINPTLITQGNIAAGATDSGNPLKAGGVYRATLPTLTDGQRGDLVLSSRSELLTAFVDLVGTPTNITIADTGSTTSVGALGQVLIRGTPTTNSTVQAFCTGNSSFAFLVENQPIGTPFVGTLQFERSLEGTVWTSIGAFAAGLPDIPQTTTLEGVFHGNCSSSQFIRVRATSWTSGTARIRILSGQGTGTITIGNPLPLYDRVSRVSFRIKPASEAALVTDPAIVVAERYVVNRYRNTALTNTAVTVSSSAIALKGWNITNLNTVPVYVKFCEAVAGSVTVGTTAVVFSLFVPANGSVVMEPQCVWDRYTALAIYAVTGIADSNTTAPTTAIEVTLRTE